ncbi:MAG TPA: hypothetical protein VGE26_09240 [Sphingobacteriaceae bacterium]
MRKRTIRLNTSETFVNVLHDDDHRHQDIPPLTSTQVARASLLPWEQKTPTSHYPIS